MVHGRLSAWLEGEGRTLKRKKKKMGSKCWKMEGKKSNDKESVGRAGEKSGKVGVGWVGGSA